MVVYDPAVTFATASPPSLKEVLLRLQQQQHSELRRMAQRLSMFTTLAKFRVPDPPRWRIHDFESPAFLFARDYHAALNYGDGSGRAFLGVSHPVADAAAALGRLSPAARRTLLSQLATLDLSDAAVIAATHDTGQTALQRPERTGARSTPSSGTSPTTRWSRARPPSSTRSAAPSSSAHGSGRPASSCSTASSSSCWWRASGRAIPRPRP